MSSQGHCACSEDEGSMIDLSKHSNYLPVTAENLALHLQ